MHMTTDELRWANMAPQELVRELTIRADLTSLETILVEHLIQVLDDAGDACAALETVRVTEDTP